MSEIVCSGQAPGEVCRGPGAGDDGGVVSRPGGGARGPEGGVAGIAKGQACCIS